MKKLTNLPEFAIYPDMSQLGMLLCKTDQTVTDLHSILKLQDLPEDEMKILGKKINECDRVVIRLKSLPGMSGNASIMVLERNLNFIKTFLKDRIGLTVKSYNLILIDNVLSEVDVIDTSEVQPSGLNVAAGTIIETVEPSVFYRGKKLHTAKVITYKHS
jgi:hypothetical protein